MEIKKYFTEDYITDLSIRLSHHSSAIEGNKISFTDTATIVLDGTIPNSNIKIRDFYEIDNHIYAINEMFSLLGRDEKLNINIIKDLNKLLMYKLHHNAGNFKTNENAIRGASFNTASVIQTPMMMYQWLGNLEYKLENSKTEEEKIKAIIESHIEFERIHPFSDGNGRTGRLIMIYSLLQENIIPFVITVENRKDYIRFLNDYNVNDFYNLSKELQSFEKIKLIGLHNVEIENIEDKNIDKIVEEIFENYIEENELDSLDEDDYDNIYDEICDTLNITDEDNDIKDIIIEVLDEKYQDFNEVDIEI